MAVQLAVWLWDDRRCSMTIRNMGRKMGKPSRKSLENRKTMGKHITLMGKIVTSGKYMGNYMGNIGNYGKPFEDHGERWENNPDPFQK